MRTRSFGRKRGWLWTVLTAGALGLGGSAYAQSPGGASAAQPERAPGAQDRNATAGTGRSDADRAATTTDAPPPPMPVAITEDARVVAKLHHINTHEIAAGKLAQDRGQAKQVRDFGAQMVREHQTADKKLLAYADKRGIDANAMPAAGSNDEAKDTEKLDRLATLSGADFDRAYVAAMVEGHRKAMDLVSTAKDKVSDTQLRTMLSQLSPVLAKHHQAAQSLAGSDVAKQGTEAPRNVQGRRPQSR